MGVEGPSSRENGLGTSRAAAGWRRPMCSSDCDGCRSLRAALVGSLEERELGSLTIEEVMARAGMSVEAVSHRCATLPQCAMAAYREVDDELYELYELVLGRDEPWRERCRQLVRATTDVFARNRGAARLWLVESDGVAVPELRELRAAHRERLVRLLAREYARSGEPPRLPTLHIELLVGATFRRLQEEFIGGGLEATRTLPAPLENVIAVFEPVLA